MTYEHLLYDLRNGVLTITLNRPEVYNAINDPLSYELQDAFKRAGRDEDVRVVVLTGAGKGFCSGQDLKAVQGDKDRSLADSVRRRYNPLILSMHQLPKPIVGRLNGVAAGAGCSLALACDLTVAAEGIYLTELFVGIGLVLDSGSSYFLPRLVGSARAFELATLATRVPAREAAAMGLINRTVPADELDATVNELAAHYAQAPTRAIGLIKRMLHHADHITLAEALEYEAQCQEAAGRTHDHREGVLAFLEKRKPQFTGR